MNLQSTIIISIRPNPVHTALLWTNSVIHQWGVSRTVNTFTLFLLPSPPIAFYQQEMNDTRFSLKTTLPQKSVNYKWIPRYLDHLKPLRTQSRLLINIYTYTKITLQQCPACIRHVIIDWLWNSHTLSRDLLLSRGFCAPVTNQCRFIIMHWRIKYTISNFVSYTWLYLIAHLYNYV